MFTPQRKPERLKLIFNPRSGRASIAPAFLHEVLTVLQALNYLPEVYLLQPDSDLKAVIENAYDRRIRLFVACGGDGTVELVAYELIGKRATLGILPAGTHNNIALSLGIPVEVKPAAELLRNGQRMKIDVGIAHCGEKENPFLEVCSIGLFSALFDSADNLQRGNLSGLGEILSTLATFPLARIQLELDEKGKIDLEGHVALAANLPYFSLNYQVTPDSPIDDGILDVVVFTEFSKLELVGNVLQTTRQGTLADPRIRRYHARRVNIDTQPSLPALTDGTVLGHTPVSLSVKQQALKVVTGLAAHRQPRWGFLRNFRFLRFLQK